MASTKFQKDSVYRMNVKHVDSFNGKKAYIVEYEGQEYRVPMYPYQSADKSELDCVYMGDSAWGKPLFQQDYSEVLNEFYEEDRIYSFTVSQECVDNNTGSSYYLLTDEYGLHHRVYNQESPLIKKGDKVDCRVMAIESKYLSLEIIPKEPPKTSFALGDVFNLAKMTAPQIDFSQIDYGKDKTLRDYQIENKRKIYEAWQHYRSVMLQMPTGTGKTRLFVSIARDIFEYGHSIKKTLKVLILAHRKELIQQISEHLGEKYRLAHGLIMSQNIEQRQFSMQVGSVPTLNRRLTKWEDKNFDVIIIDEAHHVKAKSYKKIIDLYPQAKILGVTATPYRLNGAGFRPEFDELIISPSVAEFIKRGYLSEYEYFSIKPDSNLQHDIDRMKLDFEGDYLESEMMGVMDRDHIRAKILSTYQTYAKDKKGIIYTISRAHNQHLCDEFNKAGIISAAIDSETPKEKRDELVAKFRRGAIQVLLNVNIFSEGFDCPDVEVIQLARPTKSLAMYLQQVGRGFRPAPGKDKLLILDNVGLYNKFGFPSARRKWRYHFEGKPVDESPAAQTAESLGEERIVQTIVEGDENVELLYKSNEELVALAELDTIVRDYKSDFIQYAMRELDLHTLNGYVRNIESYLDGYINSHIDPKFKSLFNTVDIDELQAIRDKLVADKDYVEYNNRKHHIYSAAFRKYRAFASWYNQHKDDLPPLPEIDSSSELPASDSSYLEAFKAYLRNYGYSYATIDSILTTLHKDVDPFIRQLIDSEHKGLTETCDLSLLNHYKSVLEGNLGFATMNRIKDGRLAAALNLYIKFAEFIKRHPEDIVGKTFSADSENNQTGQAPVTYYYPMQEEFENYLKSKFIKAPAIRNYSHLIKDIIDPVVRKSVDTTFKSFYYIDDIHVVERLYSFLKDDKEFKQLNKDHNNQTDVVIRKYIDFLQTRGKAANTVEKTKVAPAEPTEVESPKEAKTKTPTVLTPRQASSIADIDATLKELDDLISLLKKNGLPVNPEVEEKKRSLRIQKATILQSDLITNPIKEYMDANGLLLDVSFTYSGRVKDIDEITPKYDPSLQQRLGEILQIESLMEKNGLPVSKEVLIHKRDLSQKIDLGNKVRQFENWLVAHMVYLNLDDMEVETLSYTPREGFTISFKETGEVDAAPRASSSDSSFVLDRTPAPKVKGHAILQVRLGLNKVICKDTATDTFIEAIEYIGIEKVKALDIMMYGRPMIAPKPHPGYKQQCKRLSNGEYVMTLSTTEKKMQLINSIAKYYDLPVKAEIVGSKK